MAKWAHTDVLDAKLKYIADNGTRLFVCSAQPTTYAEASSTYMLAQKVMTVGDGNGHYTVGAGAVNGRRVTVAAQAGVTVSNSGTANHVAIADSVNSKLLVVTTLPQAFAVVQGGQVNVPAFDLTSPDPT